MLILNGIVGISLFIGGLKFREQKFSEHSATISLVSIVSIVIFTMVFPTFTTSIKGPYYSTPQLLFVSAVCLIIYAFFLIAQTSRHRDYFLTKEDNKQHAQPVKISNAVMAISVVFLLVSLGIVVLLSKKLSPVIEEFIISRSLPKSLVGIIIAFIILLPEGIAAIIAVRNNRLQTSLNLAMGSALASIGLTIPCVAIVSVLFKMDVVLGLDIKSMILLGLSVFTVMLSLAKGRTNIVYGVVLLVNLFAYIFLIIYP
jgi:Ca2+:H+ antiporter